MVRENTSRKNVRDVTEQVLLRKPENWRLMFLQELKKALIYVFKEREKLVLAAQDLVTYMLYFMFWSMMFLKGMGMISL